MIKRALRFMKCRSSPEQRKYVRGRLENARLAALPNHVEAGFHTGQEASIAVERPDQESAENGLEENLGDFHCGQIVADFAALLSELNHFGMQRKNALLQIEHGFADRGAGEIGLENRADDGGIARRLLGHELAEGTEKIGHGFAGAASLLDGGLKLVELHFTKGKEDMFLARKIVEEGALAEIGGIGDVLDGGFGEAFLGE